MEEVKKDLPKVYFGVDHKEKYYLPDTNNEQWIEIKKMKVAKKADYQNSLGELSEAREVENKDGTKQIVLFPNPAKMGMLHKKLMDSSVVNYNVYMLDEKNEPKLETGFDFNIWNKLYETMDEEIENGLVNLIYKLNPSLGVSNEKKNK